VAGSGTNRRPSVMQGREDTGLLLMRRAASAARRGPRRRRAGVAVGDAVVATSQGDEGLRSGVTGAAECGQRVVHRLEGRRDTRRTCGIKRGVVKAVSGRAERVGVVVETDGWISHAAHVPRPRRVNRWVRASTRRGSGPPYASATPTRHREKTTTPARTVERHRANILEKLGCATASSSPVTRSAAGSCSPDAAGLPRPAPPTRGNCGRRPIAGRECLTQTRYQCFVSPSWMITLQSSRVCAASSMPSRT
jgi:hypothetical protein